MRETARGWWQLVRRSFSPTPGPGTPWPLFFVGIRAVLLSRRKTPFLFAFLLLPLAITLAISGALDTFTSDYPEGTGGGRQWFHDIVMLVFFPLVLPIVVAVYATGAIGEEVEGKTLPYLFTRPVYRSWILFARSISSFVASTILAILALTVTFFVAVSFTENPFDHLDQLFAYWAAVGLTVLATGGVFLLMGVLIRPAVIIIAIYTFIWETLLSNLLPSNVLKFSFVWYIRAFLASFTDRETPFIQGLLVDVPSAGQAAAFLILAGILGIAASLMAVSYKDYNV